MDYNTIAADNLNSIMREIAEYTRMAEEITVTLDDIKNGGYYSSFYKNATDAINDLLEPEKARYNTRDIHALKELVEAYTEAWKRIIFCARFFPLLRAINGIGVLSGVIVKVIGTRFFIPWTIGAVKRWPLLKQCILTLVQSGLYTMKRIPRKGRKI